MLDMRADVRRGIRVSEVVADFLDECRIRNLSPKTIRWYTDRLSVLFRDVWDGEFASVTVRQVRAVLAALMETKTPSTVNGYVRAAKVLLNYAIDNDLAVGFSPRKLKKLKEPQRIPPCFTLEQASALLDQPDRSTFLGLRDFTMMSLLVDVGLRLGELTGLHVGQADSPYLRVLGKGDKERTVAMSDTMAGRLRKFLRARARALEAARMETDYLFPTRSGNRLSNKRVDTFLKRYGREAGVTGVRVSAHTFRYTYASHALRNGMSLTSLQTCLGHTTLAMTRHYAVVNDADAFRESRACSPLVGLI